MGKQTRNHIFKFNIINPQLSLHRALWEHREQANKVTEIIKFKWGLELRLDMLHRAVQRHERMEYFLGIRDMA